MHINSRDIGTSYPTYVIAEISANHNQSFERALTIVRAAKKAGADAVKVQTYTADTITIDCDNDYFQIKGTLWDGMTLHRLYQDAYTPWDWQPKIRELAHDLGMDFISSPFDPTAVEFLEVIGVDAYKIASPEIIDIPLLKQIAQTRKSVIMSTGMATLSEIDEAVKTLREFGTEQLLLLKCTSAYPAPAREMNLRTIVHMADAFNSPVGLSDHTIGYEVAVAAVALGATAIEKHLTLSRADGGPDSGFSMEPEEFKAMVDAVRIVETAIGEVRYQPSANEITPHLYRRSVFVVDDLKAGEVITEEKVRSIRPGHGLHPRYLPEILGRTTAHDVKKGTPFSWDMVESAPPSSK